MGRQLVPVQQLFVPVGLHGVPTGSHVTAVHREAPPSRPGTQGRPLQHWSRNWQTLPAAMQQPGVPS